MKTAMQATPKSTQPLRFGARYNVLVVDDDRSIRRTVERALQRAGTIRGDEFTIKQAINLEDAKVQLRENQEAHKPPFDLMITDNSMPGTGQGLALLEFTSGLGDEKPAHAFMLSSDIGIEEQALARGAEGFFDKFNIFTHVESMLERAFGPGPTAAPTLAESEAIASTAGGAATSVATTASPPRSTAAGGRPRTGSASSTGLRRALSSPDLSDTVDAFTITRGRGVDNGESKTTEAPAAGDTNEG